MNVNEVKGTIREGNHAARESRTILEQVDAEGDSAAGLARLTIHDSQDRDAQAGLRILEDLGREVELTMRRIDAAVDHADAYLKTLG
ncbi:hypothetical protein AAH979_22550 [Plantactinospora sp. ZYX-F-223]|uniref:hypothetical protein n=1 Tax=Plantactinospora sp. ZYX-F-223 TaxID=3144103 RepID=UPI0031FD5F55